MAAIRIIDDHLELANIGTNTHAQIDTHIAAADDYVKRDGSLALTSDWDIGDTRKILADEIRARDGAGLKLYDDGGNGIFVKDGGNVGIGTDAPGAMLDVGGFGTPIDVSGIGEDYAKSLMADDYDGVSGFQMYNASAGTKADFRFMVADNAKDQYLAFSMPGTGNTVSNLFGLSRSTSAFIFLNSLGSGTDRDLAIGTIHDTALVFGQSNAEVMRIHNNGNVGIYTTTPTAKLDVNSDILRLRTPKTPATAGAAGNQGDICWDASYIYVCTATNSWERAAIAAW